MSRKIVYIALSQFCQNDDRPRRMLEGAGFEIRRNGSGRRIRREEILEALGQADAVLAGVEPYDAELLLHLPRLRCISRCGVGTDSIDLGAAQRLNIAVFTTPYEVVEPVAQMTMAMILALARNFPAHSAGIRNGLWLKRTGHLLSEWTIGLIGFGRIGRTVQRYLDAFGPRVLVTDPNVRPGDIPSGVRLCDLDSLLAESDLVSIHAALRPEEGSIIGYKELRRMKVGARLVNTARGYLVDERALCQALTSGRLSAAAIDVFESEPYAGPLVGLPQVLCTPHIASLTRASRIAMELRCAENVVKFFEHRVHSSPLESTL